jgi:hypothetical protein
VIVGQQLGQLGRDDRARHLAAEQDIGEQLKVEPGAARKGGRVDQSDHDRAEQQVRRELHRQRLWHRAGLQHLLGVARHLDLAPRLAATRPSAPIRKVARSIPIYLRPYIDFSTQVPNASLIAPSSSRQRHLQVIFGDELVVLLHRVARHADDLAPGLGEVAGQRGEILRLAGAARRVVLGIEIEHQRRPGAARLTLRPSLSVAISAGTLSPSLIMHRSF